MRTIAVINRKGGSGKTTTAVNTAAALAEMDLPVLVVDLDPQASASDWLDRRGSDQGLREAITVTGNLDRLAAPTDTPGLDIVAATSWLVTAEKTMRGDLSVGISRALGRLPKRWAFVLVDCPPSVSYLSIGVMMGVRELVIPVETHAMALTGADAVIDELGPVQALNPQLVTVRLLPCRVTRTRHSRAVIEAMEADYPEEVTAARIRESIKLAEAADARQPITTYAPDSVGSIDYRAFADELFTDAAAVTEPSVSRWRAALTRAASDR